MPTLSLLAARNAVDAVCAELGKLSVSAVIAVADDHGELILLVRLDGARFSSITIAANKAWTAARECRTSRAVGQAARDPKTGFDIGYYGDPRYTGWGGGVPIVVGGVVVGAFAVSGLKEEDDMKWAEIGASLISKPD
jgi:glc operon protein GlcG